MAGLSDISAVTVLPLATGMALAATLLALRPVCLNHKDPQAVLDNAQITVIRFSLQRLFDNNR